MATFICKRCGKVKPRIGRTQKICMECNRTHERQEETKI